MKVYKFGGASVKDAQGVRNLQHIIAQESDDLVVVVSAMGKTTNALEGLLKPLIAGRLAETQRRGSDMWMYHERIIRELHLNDSVFSDLNQMVQKVLQERPLLQADDQLYDSVVSLGERLSTYIVAAYLKQCGMHPVLWDMTQLLRTDHTYREAVPDMETSSRLMRAAWDAIPSPRLVVAQGFIGGSDDGYPTTLGREGSDYSAAIIGNILDAQSVTIWKDVPGILNADPRLVPNTIKIDELSYNDAVELAYSGAQVIHPKTIRPLHNKHIPLYVKPFNDYTAPGSVIRDEAAPIHTPVYIWRKNQILVTMRAKDFSFVLEESLSHIFEVVRRNRLRVSLIQSSAVTISVCMDYNEPRVNQAIAELKDDYIVTYNSGLSLLTIRGTTPQILQQEQQGRTILLSQTTRRTARLVIKENNLIQ